MRRTLAALTVCLLVAACGDDAPPEGGVSASADSRSAAPPPVPSAPPQDGGVSATASSRSAAPAAFCARRGADVELGGAVLHLPRHGARPWPVVVALHGSGASGAQARAFGFSRLGDREGFAALYPTAQRNGFWSLNPSYRPDDVVAMRSLLERLVAEPCVDAARVFATGVSNGGGFAARLGCELSDLVRGVAPVAGGYKALPACRPARPVALFELHGTADAVVPYRGVPPERRGSAPRLVQGWAARNGCSSSVTTRPRSLVVRVRWRGCRAPVEHLRLSRTGHGWPGLFVMGDADPTGVEATREVWRFFSRVR